MSHPLVPHDSWPLANKGAGVIRYLSRRLRKTEGPSGMFHEDWYPSSQVRELQKAVKKVQHLTGKIIEIGCWEGKSTSAIANVCYPDIIDAVDTWQGNIEEDPDHITVKIASERDVFAVFKDNMKKLTKGNFRICRQDCFEYLNNLRSPVKFCHIDACHNYEHVKRTLEMLLPKLVKNGVSCGDDFQSAHMGRTDLNGGVERAIKETLEGFRVAGNFWWYQHPK